MKGDIESMYIGKRYLQGEAVGAEALTTRPMKSEKIEEIFRRVKRRIEE